MAVAAAWVSAIASLGALLAAIAAGRSAKRLYEIESERDRIERVSREASSARLMNAWAAFHAPDLRQPKDGSHGLVVSNGGEGPVFDVLVRSNDQTGKAQHPMHLHVLPPGGYFAIRNKQFHWDFPAPTTAFAGVIRPISNHESWRVTSVTFTDSAGIRWRRDDVGLHRE